jgi:hypothetical protein
VWFKKALLFTFIFIVGALVVVPKTRIAQDFMRARFLPWYEQSLGCSVSCDKISFSFLFPTVECYGVNLVSRDSAMPWRCDCKKVTLKVSWSGIIMRRRLNLSVILDHPIISSGAQGSQVFFIEDHVARYFGGPEVLPVTLKEIIVRHAEFRVVDQKDNLELQSVFSCDYKKMYTGYGFNVHCEDGSLRYGSFVLAHSCTGYWQSMLEPGAIQPGAIQPGAIGAKTRESWTQESGTPKLVESAITITGHGQGELTLFQNDHAERCNWESKAVHGETTFTLWRPKSDDLCKLTLDAKKVNATVTVALAHMAEHLAPSAYARMVKGTLTGTYHATRAEGIEKGALTLAVNDGAYGNHEFIKEIVFLVPPRSNDIYSGNVALKMTEKDSLSGVWSWEPKTKKGSARLINAAGSELGSFSLGTDSNRKGGYVATTVLHLSNDEQEKETTLLVKAEAQYLKGALSLHAERGQEQFFLEGTLGNTFDVSLLRWIDGAQKTLIDLSYDSAEKHRISGVVDVGAVQRLAKQVWGISLHGEGAVEVRGHYVNKRYELVLEGSKLAVRLPRIYNVINGLAGTFIFDPQESSLNLSDVRCTLHRGSFSIPHATINYDPAEEVVVFAVPLVLNAFWFNIEKDLYAQLSGELMLKRTGATTPFLSGELLVERAHVSESLLKLPVLQKTSPQSMLDEAHLYPLGLDVKVRSKNPIRVTLARLEGSAHIAMQVGNTLAEPTLSGVIRLDDGTIVFPYKPLMIRKAQLTFVPQQSYDPTIELFAKNRIKSYDVSLTIQGTLSSHDIRLQSTPSLSDEQLIGLLYAGSEQGALGALVPSMVMKNITSIFSKNGADASTSGGDKNSWRERLKRIHVVPSFTDQRGRGGVRGTLEVDINDRWRALMQKNFSLSEDTRFELDYDISDDLSLRALRDERRDIGAEMEVKLKF